MNMFVLILLVVNFLTMPLFYLFLKSRFNADKLLGDIRIEVDKLVLELGREADRDVALLESRIANLRSLMDEADRRILLADRDDLRRREIDIQNKVPLIVKKEPINITETHSKSEPEPKKSKPVTIYTRPMPVNTASFSEPVIPTKEAVLSLVRKGFSADLIANQLSLPLGEVELILNMNSSSL